MKGKSLLFQIILIGLSLILVGSVVAYNSKAQARQQIVDYINTMMPVMEAHADWYDTQNRLFQQSDPDYSKFLLELRDLLDEMEKISKQTQRTVNDMPTTTKRKLDEG